MDFPKRKSIRLKHYDYSTNGAYFITICTHNNAYSFGKIIDAKLCTLPNNPEKIVEKWLLKMEEKFCHISIDKFVVMPNHIHFILSICNLDMFLKTGEQTGSPLRDAELNFTQRRESTTITEMIKWFKTQTTNDFIRGVKNGYFQPFDKHFWQRNYFEHVIRNQQSYNEIWKYIDNNVLSWELDKLNQKPNI